MVRDRGDGWVKGDSAVSHRRTGSRRVAIQPGSLQSRRRSVEEDRMWRYVVRLFHARSRVLWVNLQPVI
jgi:hypothetical protein